ncbi:hypothetical protein B0T10DRAFT_453503 [Thelonectria olida]|uniref:Uncharacterized protein n=1 Tax=Thelonectria olida TaxID=1576542 RepID=A0A9P9AVF8_9HYPO|nr:hypothetical protein B0T10DRAFT_453503 [Thelonectria olida]
MSAYPFSPTQPSPLLPRAISKMTTNTSDWEIFKPSLQNHRESEISIHCANCGGSVRQGAAAFILYCGHIYHPSCHEGISEVTGGQLFVCLACGTRCYHAGCEDDAGVFSLPWNRREINTVPPTLGEGGRLSESCHKHTVYKALRILATAGGQQVHLLNRRNRAVYATNGMLTIWISIWGVCYSDRGDELASSEDSRVIYVFRDKKREAESLMAQLVGAWLHHNEAFGGSTMVTRLVTARGDTAPPGGCRACGQINCPNAA